jgi:hypothetical protein
MMHPPPKNPPEDMWAFLKAVLSRIIRSKKYWLIPLWAILVALALILFLTGNGHLIPAIYIAF